MAWVEEAGAARIVDGLLESIAGGDEMDEFDAVRSWAGRRSGQDSRDHAGGLDPGEPGVQPLVPDAQPSMVEAQ